jgi:hypothetical protein
VVPRVGEWISPLPPPAAMSTSASSSFPSVIPKLFHASKCFVNEPRLGGWC